MGEGAEIPPGRRGIGGRRCRVWEEEHKAGFVGHGVGIIVGYSTVQAFGAI